MELLLIKHAMDENARQMTLDEVFLEALELTESRATEIEEQEYALYVYLHTYPDFISNITDEYKKSVIAGLDYEILG